MARLAWPSTHFSLLILGLSHSSNGHGLSSGGEGKGIGLSSGGNVSDGAGCSGELVKVSLQESLEGVGLLVSDPSLVVLIEVGPGVLEVGVQVAGDVLG